MRVLIVGAHGMLGTDLAATAPSETAIELVDRDTMDLRQPPEIERVLDDFRPHWVVNAAAYTAVDRAESERAEAFAINADAVGQLGRLCAARGVRVAHFSTDYVFPGDGARPYRETDPTSAVNAYGESKLAGERALLAAHPSALVIRTQWLFGVHGKSFPRTMWERARRREATRVVSDQLGRPTLTVDLALATWRLLGLEAAGIFHATNSGVASWYELAAEVFASLGAPELITPCRTADYPTPARRPAYSVLDTSKLESTLGGPLPDWRHALARFLRDLETTAAPVPARETR